VSDIWARKIAALLHDPPDKALQISGHVQRAEKIRDLALGEAALERSDEQVVSRADWWASGADRINFPAGVQVHWAESPKLTHPLCGRKVDLRSLKTLDTDAIFETIEKAVQSLVGDASTPKDRFVRLWRRLPEELISAEAQGPSTAKLGELWKVLPAETRIPDHSIWQHNRLASALAGALPEPAFVVFTIGSVQRFISASRRLQDLCVSSLLLSWLMWEGLEWICEEYGPDCVIYPSLHGNPLADLWLRSKGWLPQSPGFPADGLAGASLPNRALILLPKAEAEMVGRRIADRVAEAWSRLVTEVKQALESELCVGGSGWSKLWSTQPQNYFDIYWLAYPWAVGAGNDYGKPDAAMEEYKRLVGVGDNWEFEHVTTAFSGGQYRLNVGHCYSLFYSLSTRGLQSRKALRLSYQGKWQQKEEGEKCTLCGERQALYSDAPDRRSSRNFWSELAGEVQRKADSGNNSKLKGHYAAIKPGGQERLCTVCTVKRFVQPLVFADRLGIKGGFPSTSTVATAWFKQKVIERLLEDQSSDKLEKALTQYLNTLKDLRVPKTVSHEAVPFLQGKARGNELAGTFLEYDGDALFEETFTAERFKDDFGIEVNEGDLSRAKETLRGFLKECTRRGVSPPGRYFALLKMDGDHLGKWLGGTYGREPCFEAILHPDAMRALADDTGWKELLSKRRLIAPSYHQFISDALASFALKLVPYVVETRYPGRLVYAGGDDLLAIVPVECVLQVARELRALFSGEAVIDRSGDIEVQFGNPQVSGYVALENELVATMGVNATASAGVVIAHHYQPLGTALSAVTRTLDEAKERYGRNAICVSVLKRSGQELRVGGKWFYALHDDPSPLDTLDALLRVGDLFSSGRLATRFPYALRGEADAVSALPLGGQKTELCRLWQRHVQHAATEDDTARPLDSLQKLLTAFVSEDATGSRLQPGLVRLAEWLLAISFVARGGG